ncbi:hypothetical protein BT96DRAFT_886171 [Gymnopus androsaceus JB14]|uniref:Cytochrome c oxidase assembly protein COX20, mitochondrial n=1 Tax=Gymnopus androsaceus JB14 TaxID=1447944 RepID=A0A6A4H9I0_9AGAR|nr:hypothetical protein BT96DRAFT_886171 [Gymnopus androsaceus JB14]
MSSPSSEPSSIPPPPSAGPPSTGNLFNDSIEAAKNVEKLPCARNSLLTGLAAGSGVAFIRGVSTATPIVAGHWFAFTFVAVAAISHQVCIRQMEAERKKVTQIIESAPKRTLKKPDPSTPSSSS